MDSNYEEFISTVAIAVCFGVFGVSARFFQILYVGFDVFSYKFAYFEYIN